MDDFASSQSRSLLRTQVTNVVLNCARKLLLQQAIIWQLWLLAREVHDNYNWLILNVVRINSRIAKWLYETSKSDFGNSFFLNRQNVHYSSSYKNEMHASFPVSLTEARLSLSSSGCQQQSTKSSRTDSNGVPWIPKSGNLWNFYRFFYFWVFWNFCRWSWVVKGFAYVTLHSREVEESLSVSCQSTELLLTVCYCACSVVQVERLLRMIDSKCK